MQGKRVEVQPHLLNPGEYAYWKEGGSWYAHCPGGDDLIANLASHKVTEHEDGTITVSPSILCGDGKVEWHGYLERGVWREC